MKDTCGMIMYYHKNVYYKFIEICYLSLTFLFNYYNNLLYKICDCIYLEKYNDI